MLVQFVHDIAISVNESANNINNIIIRYDHFTIDSPHVYDYLSRTSFTEECEESFHNCIVIISKNRPDWNCYENNFRYDEKKMSNWKELHTLSKEESLSLPPVRSWRPSIISIRYLEQEILSDKGSSDFPRIINTSSRDGLLIIP